MHEGGEGGCARHGPPASDAVNVLLLAGRERSSPPPPVTAAELDSINRDLHDREKEVYGEGEDLLQVDPRGNYPVEVLMAALRRRGYATGYIRPRSATTTADVERRSVVGYLLGTGDHYLALVRDRDRASARPWALYSNGVKEGDGETARAVVDAWLTAVAGRRLRAVLRVRRRRQHHR